MVAALPHYAMYLKNKIVFLAGSTGLVGTSIIKYIIENHPDTRIKAVYNSTEPFYHSDRVEYIKADLRKKEDYRKVLSGCDCAIMAAANTAGAGSLSKRPWYRVNDNLFMNALMLETFHEENIRRIVFISSATVYQEFEGAIRENELDLNKDPHSSYLGVGWVMRYLEKLCYFWFKQSKKEFVIIRLANAYGPYAKFDQATSNFIPAIIRKSVDKMDPFEVWGQPEVSRDVIFSDDAARAIVGLLANEQIKFDIFNIGSGIKTTVGEIVEWALKYAMYTPSSINYDNSKPTTIKHKGIDCSKVIDIIGWQAQITIEEGIKRTTKWWKENKNWWKK